MLLLRIEHVENRALADSFFFANALQRGLRRFYRRLTGTDVAFCRNDQSPLRADILAGKFALFIDLLAAPRQDFDGLPDLRGYGACLIERDGQLAEHACVVLLKDFRAADLRAFRVARAQGQGREKLSFDLLDLMLLSALAEDRGKDSGILGLSDIDRSLAGLRQQLRWRPRVPQRARRMTDKLGKPRLIPVKCSLRDAEICLRLRETGLCLGNIGASHFAHPEPVPRCAELFGQHSDIVLAHVHDRLVAHDVHIGGGCIQKNVLLR